MKKFYKLVNTVQNENGFAVTLDGKPVKTPGGKVLNIFSQTLADEIVKEWAAQEEEIIPDSMPLMQLAATAQEKIPAERQVMQDKIMAYINTDLLCYRTDQPLDIAAKQNDAWDPWLAWLNGKYGVTLETTTGLGALTQPLAAHEAIAGEIGRMDDWVFTALQLAASQTGSVVLALAFVCGDATPEQLFDAANVEENHKAEIYNEAKYGSAPMQEKKQAAMRRDLFAARKFLDLLEF